MKLIPNTELIPGLYELPIDRQIKAALDILDRDKFVAEIEQLDSAESYGILAQHLGKVIARVLAGFPSEGRVEKQTELCNALIRMVTDHEDKPGHWEPVAYELAEEGKRLMAVSHLDPIVGPTSLRRSQTPTAISSLLTGTRMDPSLATQIALEMATSDRVDLLVSFIKWSGIRVLEKELIDLTEKRGRALRVITTSYTGATDFKALEFLRELPNTEIRISYNTGQTRMHAKAFIFHRETGFGTAYVGSANISNPALLNGLEWTTKISQYESSHLWEKIQATFETYWQDHREFVSYSAGDQDQLLKALKAERSGGESGDAILGIDIRPYPFQERILEALAAEREIHGRYRNLVVAATGTGKTVVAAFDYLRFRAALQAEDRHRPVRLLFVAHREEILKQARRWFRELLRDPDFGDLWVGSERPEKSDHVFASIQTLNSREIWNSIDADRFDYIVVDEVHHGTARSYGELLNFVKPRVLLGLTATPERADGKDVLALFGGRISAEIRLPEAINRQLLTPFQYFGITDSVDLRQLVWRGGYVDADLSKLYVDNDERASVIVNAVRRRLLDANLARGLGFCVTVKHAEYMAEFFRKCGIPSEALSGGSSAEVRNNVQARLRNRETNFIFTVDLYNEGVDIPEVDTILLLRPTESLTVFLQQLGRGLRLCEGKDYLTVLDFIGQAHANYPFEARFRALMDGQARRVDEEIEGGFPHVPLGCTIVLDRMAQKYVLANIRAALKNSKSRLLQRIRDLRNERDRVPALGEFLDYYELKPADIYARGGWSRLCADAGISEAFNEPDEEQLSKGLRRVAEMDSVANLRDLLHDVTAHEGSGSANSDTDRHRLLLMLHFTLWGRTFPAQNLDESLARLRANPMLFSELVELLKYRLDELEHLTFRPTLAFPCPLEVHASYSRDQILAGLGEWTLEQQREVREGVLALKNLPADIFFITLNKTEKDYSPTTLYQDYAINEELFHWQSQSTTSDSSPTGQRYIGHKEKGREILLFARENKDRDGITSPYIFIGPADYVRHTGSRPMSIVWRLRHPLPAWMAPAVVTMRAA